MASGTNARLAGLFRVTSTHAASAGAAMPEITGKPIVPASARLHHHVVNEALWQDTQGNIAVDSCMRASPADALATISVRGYGPEDG